MKKLILILIFLCFGIRISFCQLLSNPSLDVEDIELALSNPDHLRKILLAHEFVYETGVTGSQNQPWSIRNPLFAKAVSLNTEYWRMPSGNDTSSSQNELNIIRSIRINDWKPGSGPHPDAIKTISIQINDDPGYADQTESFLQRIKDRYPIKRQRYIGNTELQRAYSEPIKVLTNITSRIEVRISQGQILKDSGFYIVSFDLVR